jgi:hypothetical protein
MSYRIAADLILLVHLVFASFAVFGGALVALDLRWAWLHVPAVVWSCVVNLADWTCPLTPIENRFRALAGQAGYSGGFVQHYVGRAVYPGGMPRRMELIAGLSVLTGNVLVYALMAVLHR